ncbi:hypothetical protein P9139_12515 [Curtobacterium flaccumfaciens]|nr:hypothetical protein P9139_12515 [Curtobacterium flaccumfaciens]
MIVSFANHSTAPVSLGGAERSLLRFVEDWQAIDPSMTPTFITKAPRGKFIEALDERGWSYDALRFRGWALPSPQPAPAAERAAFATVDYAAVNAIIRRYERARPDLVVTNTLVAPWASFAAAVLGIPQAWFVREYGDLDHGLQFQTGRAGVLGDIGLMAGAVVTNSEAMRAHLAQYIPADKLLDRVPDGGHGTAPGDPGRHACGRSLPTGRPRAPDHRRGSRRGVQGPAPRHRRAGCAPRAGRHRERLLRRRLEAPGRGPATDRPRARPRCRRARGVRRRAARAGSLHRGRGRLHHTLHDRGVRPHHGRVHDARQAGRRHPPGRQRRTRRARRHRRAGGRRRHVGPRGRARLVRGGPGFGQEARLGRPGRLTAVMGAGHDNAAAVERLVALVGTGGYRLPQAARYWFELPGAYASLGATSARAAVGLLANRVRSRSGAVGRLLARPGVAVRKLARR